MNIQATMFGEDQTLRGPHAVIEDVNPTSPPSVIDHVAPSWPAIENAESGETPEAIRDAAPWTPAFCYATGKLDAVDYGAGNKLVVSSDGNPDNTYCPRSDVIAVFEKSFANGADVGTEASTLRSFGVLGQDDRLAALQHAYPERKLILISTRRVRNELRREGGGAGEIPDNEAAAAIWRIVARGEGRRWDPHAAMPPGRIKFDPVRPNVAHLIMLRNGRYAEDAMRHHVYRFLPPYGDSLFGDGLTETQRLILGNGKAYSDSRAAAFVISVTEADTYTGWKRVIGANSDGHPSIYRHVLLSGSGAHVHVNGYKHKHHFSGVAMKDVMSELKALRAHVIAHPDFAAYKAELEEASMRRVWDRVRWRWGGDPRFVELVRRDLDA
jgi:hypothetical protein